MTCRDLGLRDPAVLEKCGHLLLPFHGGGPFQVGVNHCKLLFTAGFESPGRTRADDFVR